MRTSVSSVAVAAALVSLACVPKDQNEATTGAISDSAAIAAVPALREPGTYTLKDFRLLRWIDGRWSGKRADGFKFYEQYTFVDDSTIAMHSYPDPTFSTAGDSSKVMLRSGRVTNDGGDAVWVATRLDSLGAAFAPQRGAVNFFTWTRESPKQWNASLRWTDQQGHPQSVAYTLQRVGR